MAFLLQEASTSGGKDYFVLKVMGFVTTIYSVEVESIPEEIEDGCHDFLDRWTERDSDEEFS